MTGLAADAAVRLSEAVARRRAAEDRVEQTWQDATRRSFVVRIVQPLDQEATRAHAAVQALDAELGRALNALAR